MMGEDIVDLEQVPYLLASIAASIALGLAFIQYLTVHPRRIGILRAVCVALLLVVFLSIAYPSYSSRSFAWASAASGALGFFVGHIIMTHRVLSTKDSREMPVLTREKGDPGKGHVAVIYFSHGEPADYSPIGWINQFRELDETGVRFVPWLARPFFLFMLRRAYIRVGESHHRSEHIRTFSGLERSFRDMGDMTTRFYLSFLDDEPRPEAAVISALNDGASRIVLAEVFVTRSNHTKEGEDAVSKIGLSEFNTQLAFTEPLWNSKILHKMFLDKTDRAAGDTDKKKVGILLVGHGQPAEWDACFSTCTEQEKLFMQSITSLLCANGYEKKNIGTAWMSFREPKPKEKVEEIARNGVHEILYFAATISADSLHSQYDIPHLVSEADIPGTIKLTNMGAWNDHELVIAAIKERIDEVLH